MPKESLEFKCQAATVGGRTVGGDGGSPKSNSTSLGMIGQNNEAEVQINEINCKALLDSFNSE